MHTRRDRPLAVLAVLATCLALAYECHAAPAHPWNPVKLNLAAGQSRDGYLYIPPTYTKTKPSPLLIFFHGAGKGSKDVLEMLEQAQPLLDQQRCLVLMPESRGPTWDLMMRGSFGPDMVFLRSAMTTVFQKYNIDRKRVAIAGFSDGATVAVSLLPLGSIATHIIGWSPGGFAPPMVNGKPKVSVFHGTKDQLFPIDQTSRQIVPQIAKVLPSSEINYVEWSGAHDAPPPLIKQGLEWFLLNKPLSNTKFKQQERPAARRPTSG